MHCIIQTKMSFLTVEIYLYILCYQQTEKKNMICPEFWILTFCSSIAAKDQLRKELEVLRAKPHWRKAYFYLWDEVPFQISVIMFL